MPLKVQVFLGALMGSIFVEVIALYFAFKHDPPKFPPQFKYWQYYPIRLTLAIGIASLAVVEGVSTIAAAVTMGALALPALDSASGEALRNLFGGRRRT